MGRSPRHHKHLRKPEAKGYKGGWGRYEATAPPPPKIKIRGEGSVAYGTLGLVSQLALARSLSVSTPPSHPVQNRLDPIRLSFVPFRPMGLNQGFTFFRFEKLFHDRIMPLTCLF